jgi:hypothetical protein
MSSVRSSTDTALSVDEDEDDDGRTVMGFPHGRMSDRGCVVEEEWLIFLNSNRTYLMFMMMFMMCLFVCLFSFVVVLDAVGYLCVRM